MTDKANGARLGAHSLTCEYIDGPLGVESATPHLSWKLTGSGRHNVQRAYQILVATSPDKLSAGAADVWDSGKVDNSQSTLVPYGGRTLLPRETYYWTVRAWNGAGEAGEYAAPSRWVMGLQGAADWTAQWISSPDWGDVQPELPTPISPIMRKEFTLEKPIGSARVFICGLGYHELRINGRKVGDHALDPGFTRYDVRTLYVVHDVTEYLRQGANAAGVMLGNGWYNCQTQEVWSFKDAPWRDKPKLRASIEIVFTDGTRQSVDTDITWYCAPGPNVKDALRNGDEYDARREMPGWDTPGFDQSEWKPAVVIPGPGGILTGQLLAVRVTDTLVPKSVTEVKPGVWVVDIGQDMTGWVQLTVDGAAGTTITLKYSELLGADGDIDPTNINVFVKEGDFQCDRYTLRGGGVEVWEPRFTYHGFRFIQVTGFPGTPTIDNFRARVVRSAFEPAGDFACSNTMLTRTFANARWSYIGNFVAIPTDCPHREKNGWTGDALIAAETGLFMFNAAPAYRKWLDDIQDCMRPSGQLPGICPTGGWGYNWGSGPAWDSAFTGIPWHLHEYTGDVDVLARHYDHMKRYVDFMTSMATDNILSFGLGDWCPPESKDGYGHKCPIPLTSTGYYYMNATIIARTARLLGKPEDALRYEALAATIAQAFHERFYDPKTDLYEGECQTSQACALFHGMAPAQLTESILDRLVGLIEANGWKLDFGILGGKYVPNVLVRHGRADAAYKLAAQTAYPSWGHWIERGATTLWEAWEGTTSQNHIMFGDIAAWMVKALAGINADPAWPGFKHFFVKPSVVGDLTWVKAHHECLYGTIRSGWRKEGDRLTLEVEVPVNTTATVTIPAGGAGDVTEGGRPLAEAAGVIETSAGAGSVTVTVGSGSYSFASKLP